MSIKFSFDTRIGHLTKYVAEFGCIPRTGRNGDDKFIDHSEYTGLGKWCNRQREHYTKGLNDVLHERALTDEQIESFESIPGWTWEIVLKTDTKIALIKKYCEIHKKLPTLSSVFENEKVGRIYGSLKDKYFRNKCTDNEIELLEEIPQWKYSRIELYNDKIEELTKYLNEIKKMPLKTNDLYNWDLAICAFIDNAKNKKKHKKIYDSALKYKGSRDEIIAINASIDTSDAKPKVSTKKRYPNKNKVQSVVSVTKGGGEYQIFYEMKNELHDYINIMGKLPSTTHRLSKYLIALKDKIEEVNDVDDENSKEFMNIMSPFYNGLTKIYGDMINENILKGDLYELQIKQSFNVLTKIDINNIWLWKEVPEKVLIKYGIIESFNKYRDRRNDTNRPYKDMGVDIVAIDNKSNLYLIQCKNYCGRSTITDKCLNGFRNFMETTKYKYKGYVIYSGVLSSKLEKSLYKNTEFVNIPFDNEFKQEQTPKHQIKLEPRNYQLIAYKRSKTANRGIIAMPCGTGKTLVGCMIGADYDNVIILSPLITIALQNCERFKTQLGDEYNAININCDSGRLIPKLKRKNIISSTYDSADIILKIIEEGLNNFVIIIDEFHNLSINNCYDPNSDIYHILNSDYKIIFMSATPKIYELNKITIQCDNLNIGNICDYLVDGIDTRIFGKLIYKMNINKCINAGLICDYNVFAPKVYSIDESKIIDKTLIENKLNTKDDHEYNIKKMLFLLRTMMHNGYNKCIVYCMNSSKLENLRKATYDVCNFMKLDVNIGTIVQSVPPKQRNYILDDFRTNTNLSLLFSINILNEGIDVVECDSVYITYSSRSETKSIQRLCRTNRKNINNPGKIAGIILWCSEYSDIKDMVNDLKYSDESWNINKFVTIDYCNGDSSEINKSYNEDEINYGINSKIKDLLIGSEKPEPLITRIAKIKEYMSNLEIASIPSTTDSDPNIRLMGYTCKYLKERYKSGRLSENIIDTCNQIRLWDWQPGDYDTNFNKNIAILDKWQNFIDESGNTPNINSLPQHRSMIDGELIGDWIYRVKAKYAKGKLDQKYIDMLSKLKYWTFEIQKNKFCEKSEMIYQIIKENNGKLSKSLYRDLYNFHWSKAKHVIRHTPAYKSGILPKRIIETYERNVAFLDKIKLLKIEVSLVNENTLSNDEFSNENENIEDIEQVDEIPGNTEQENVKSNVLFDSIIEIKDLSYNERVDIYMRFMKERNKPPVRSSQPKLDKWFTETKYLFNDIQKDKSKLIQIGQIKHKRGREMTVDEFDKFEKLLQLREQLSKKPK